MLALELYGFKLSKEREWLIFCVERGCVWLIHTSSTRQDGGNEHDRFGAGKEIYIVLCKRCENTKGWNQTSQIIMLHCVKLGWWGVLIKRREVVEGARRIRSEKLREHSYI